MEIIQVGQANYEDVVAKSAVPVLIDFYADWCGPCRMLAPIVDQIAAERPDIQVCRVNVDEENALASRFNISAIPMLAVVKNGETVKTNVGFIPKEQILAML